MAEARTRSSIRSAGIALLGICLAFAAAAVVPVPALGAQAISDFSTTMSTSDAGGHPDLHTSFTLESPGDPEVAKNITIDLPAGVYGNPSAVTQCSSVDFGLSKCPPNAQAGLVTIRANYLGTPDNLLGTAPIYSVEPGSAEAARFSFVVPTVGIPVSIPVSIRSAGDYGMRLAVSGITQLIPLASVDIGFWGFPGLPAHETQRFPTGSPGAPAGCPGLADTSCLTGKVASSLPLRPLTGNPSVCTGEELPTSIEVTTYRDPDSSSTATSSYPPIVACDRATFNPAAFTRLTTRAADSASGMDLRITAPQTQGTAVSPSHIRSAVMTFPEGLSINPDAADGQTACSDADARLGQEGRSSCPDSAKIGTVSISSTALEGPLEGSVYFGEPKPGSQYRLLLTADGAGINAKLFGDLRPDPKTGRLTAEFRDLPQQPFDAFEIHLFASARGVLATPTRCTVYLVDSDLYPWNDLLPNRHASQVISINEGPNGRSCPGEKRPFDPRLVAGTSNPRAGSFSDFTLKLDRDDGDQFLGDLNFTMPPGLLATMRGVAYCPEAVIAQAAQRLGREEQAAPSCPASSAIGTSNVAAGPGTHPFHALGRMYMAGPFKGAPLSLVAVTPALAGPYDYGVVVVRVAIKVDPYTAQVIAVSDTVPSIIGGVPIRMRSIQVNIDKPNFMINPTNCSSFSVDSQGIGDQGTIASFSSYFQAANCGRLPFKPQMTIRQVGKRQDTMRSKDPSLRFDLRTRPGDANIKSVSVVLSKAWAIDQRHLGNLCSESDLLKTRCEGRAQIGRVTTTTPLLDEPLSGPAYAVSGSGNLPRLAFVLDGQVSLLPRADVSSTKSGALRTVVPVVPDAEIGHFNLTLFGGDRGYLVNTRALCPQTPISRVIFTAQNGKRSQQKVRAQVPCRAKKKSR